MAWPRWLRAAARTLADFCAFSSFHGLRFVADARGHWTERLFWLACCLLSWFGSALLMRANWTAFEDNAISFAVDTNYLAWDTNFLGVTVCEKENSEVIQKMRPPYENETVRDKDLDEVYKEVIFFKFGGIWVGTQCFDLNGNFQPQSRCPRDGLRELAYSYRRSCEETLTACTWNGVPFPCCEHFLPMETEIGLCYAFNSIHTERPVSALNTASNRASGPATLYFEVLAQSMMYVLPRQEVPTRNTNERHMQLVSPGSFYRLLVSIKEVENDPEVAHTSTAQRDCRLQAQGLPAYPKYSFSGCQVQCRADAQRHLCGCVSPLTPRAGPKDVCNLTGLHCLTKNEPRLMFIKSADDVAGAGLACNCAHGCDDQEINNILSESYVPTYRFCTIHFPAVLHCYPKGKLLLGARVRGAAQPANGALSPERRAHQAGLSGVDGRNVRSPGGRQPAELRGARLLLHTARLGPPRRPRTDPPRRARVRLRARVRRRAGN